jgi:hypothetical protein
MIPDGVNINLHHEYAKQMTRRHFLRRCNSGLGAVALASLTGATPGAPRARASDA